MSSYAQKFAAQTAQTREILAKQGPRDGLAEGLRQEIIQQTRAAAREREKMFEQELIRAKATPVVSKGSKTLFC